MSSSCQSRNACDGSHAFLPHLTNIIHLYYRIVKKKPIIKPVNVQSKAVLETPRLAPLGGVLPTTLVGAPLNVGVQAVPHANPLGQQPPPFEVAQLDHPVGQVPENPSEFADIPLPVGAMTVTLGESTTVVLTLAGQLVLAQSRPT